MLLDIVYLFLRCYLNFVVVDANTFKIVGIVLVVLKVVLLKILSELHTASSWKESILKSTLSSTSSPYKIFYLVFCPCFYRHYLNFVLVDASKLLKYL